MIRHHPEARHVFDERPDGTSFQCSESFIRIFLKRSMGWSIRRGTKAAQKVPKNSDHILDRFCMRAAARIRDDNIPESCIVNCDQTGVIIQTGQHLTYEAIGAKQVAVVGQEEKRAFTLMVGVCLDGSAVPFQAVYKGVKPASLPKHTRHHRESWKRAQAAGMKFTLSGGKKH